VGGPIAGQCNSIVNNHSFVNFPTGTACSKGNITEFNNSNPNLWTWKCTGENGGALSPLCQATHISSVDTNLTCTLTAPSATTTLNKLTTWTVTPAAAKTRWYVTDTNGTSNLITIGTDTWHKTFTTLGEKTIYASRASTTPDVFGPVCTSTIRVLEGDSQTRER
jgi:hypothetical protein